MINEITFEQKEIDLKIINGEYYTNNKLIGKIKFTNKLVDKETWNKAYPHYTNIEPFAYFAEFLCEKGYETLLLFFNDISHIRKNIDVQISTFITNLLIEKFSPIEIKVNNEKVGEILQSNYYNKYEINLFGITFYENCSLYELKSKIIHLINDVIL